MDIRELPVALATMTVGQALDRMQRESISGIALKGPNELHVISYGDLIASQCSPREELTSFGIFRSVPNITPIDAQRYDLPTAPTMLMPRLELAKVDRFLRQRGYFYAAFGQVGTHVNLLSISEEGLVVYSATPKDCYCTDAHFKHGYDRGNHPALCRVDQTQIVCS